MRRDPAELDALGAEVMAAPATDARDAGFAAVGVAQGYLLHDDPTAAMEWAAKGLALLKAADVDREHQHCAVLWYCEACVAAGHHDTAAEVLHRTLAAVPDFLDVLHVADHWQTPTGAFRPERVVAILKAAGRFTEKDASQ